MLLDSGICTIYAIVPETGSPDVLPKARQQCGELSVGYARNYAARQNNERVDILVRILRNRDISTDDVCCINAEWFYIRQVQHKTDEDGMPVSDLSLERFRCDEVFGGGA